MIPLEDDPRTQVLYLRYKIFAAGSQISEQRSQKILKTGAATLFVCCLISVCSVAAFSQSGRRGSKSPAVPVPSPEAEAEAPAEKKPAADIVRVPLIVGASRNDVFTGIPFQMYDTVLQACTQRLEHAGVALVLPATKGFSRSEAVDRAKTETEGYVIWLHLRGDDLGGTYANNLDQVYIEYVVFEHTTGKLKTQGNSYQGAYRKGGVVLGSPTGGSGNQAVEYRLRAAAEDAAERILKALHLVASSTVPRS